MTVEAPKAKATKEVALFHNDVFLLDCETHSSPIWSRLWPSPNSGPTAAPSSLSLPAELLEKGGGADLQALIAMPSSACQPPSAAPTLVPRGRIAASCIVFGGSLWIFGGSCESGPRQEVTLDDLWRLPLEPAEPASSNQVWECILPLSERATMWFDSSSDEEDEEEMADDVGHILAKVDHGCGTLSKKQQKEEAHKARMQAKQARNEERNEEKMDKRELKKERQRAQAREKTANK